ncbi:MAG: dTMP kinase [gamma proteobacterium symbiont of Bathyaustriella thionipta]|nr:dTMP kinase [gamma proteobacterium symbiont of Bathyaustriella thionipta]MCU7949118.1 dTMP kinase [gamma proteobacterium symbiont of Bathyaustriella thionipta]MCU7954429.1 dTMP kinase [gamma proteobacterium symbiont of Bathyaustriella thionipta]MCU7955709.1 dTMP kinase [gamma proteobacterium symbiont of Bathyaustriella thionipta]MCU7966197.1 dTMP kinase [gamma proteobacterium symbiont of Bathyaustriella thionipta]
MFKGKFITIEGSEGAGKSTNIGFIQDYLNQKNIPFILTREPGGTPVAEKIRDLLLDKANTSLCDDAELLLMFAARSQHLNELIIPALEAGKWVISDRFTDASYAYQGGGRGLSWQKIAQLEQWVQGNLRPDATILLDIPVDKGMERVRERGETDRFEQEQLSFFNRIREAYLKLAEENPERFHIVDTLPAIEKVHKQLERVMDHLSS